MRPSPRDRRHQRRGGAAAVELALILPMLCYICVLTIDYSRIFVYWTTISECAYNGAYYLSDSDVAQSSGFSSVSNAALADAGDLSPAPSVTSTSGTDSNGNAYVEVTVTYTFSTIFTYPGVPTSTSIARKLRMAVTPP